MVREKIASLNAQFVSTLVSTLFLIPVFSSLLLRFTCRKLNAETMAANRVFHSEIVGIISIINKLNLFSLMF